MRRSELVVLLLVEAEDHASALDENRPPDQVRVLHHEIDRFLLRLRQRALLEHRAARAHELEEAVGVDVALEELTPRRFLVDVELVHVDSGRVQKSSGILAGRSTRLPVKGRFWHPRRIPEASRDLKSFIVHSLMPRAVILLSGGLDSYTAGAIARADGFALYALTIHYGQRH